jgi:hypothetical protein
MEILMAVSEEFQSSGIRRRVHWFIGNKVSGFTAPNSRVVCLDKNAHISERNAGNTANCLMAGKAAHPVYHESQTTVSCIIQIRHN